MPSEPVIMAASSERMSPNMFGQSSTSNFGASRSSTMAAESTSWCSSLTSGNSGAISATISFQNAHTSSTLALWMFVTRRLRSCASRNATRAMRATSCSS